MLLKKKWVNLAALVTAISIATVTVQIRRANAMALSNPLIGVIVIMGAVSAPVMGAIYGSHQGNVGDDILGGLDGFLEGAGIGLLLGAVGIVLLDDHGNPSMRFAPLSDGDAGKIGLTTSQVRAFNQNLDEINAVADEVAYQMKQENDVSVAVARAEWQDYGQSLDGDTLSAVQAVAAYNLQQLQARAAAKQAR